MNTSGEAADQVVRMSLEVGEAALKISGTGAKHLAVMLYTVLKEKKKTKGRVRLETLVKSGRPLTVFSVKESDLKQFVQEAKRYGVLYCAVRNPKGSSDGLVDVIVKEEDAPRINRIVDRFQFASVTEAAKIKTEIERTRAEKAKAGKSEKQEKKPEKVQVQQEKQGQAEPEKDYPQKSKEDQLMDAFHVSCASYMLCKKYGMDTSRYNFLHAPEFFEKMETQEVRVELSRARDAANAISARMAKVLDQNRNATYRQSETEKTGQDSSEKVKDKKENPEPEKKNRNPEDNIEKKHARKIRERRMQNEQ